MRMFVYILTLHFRGQNLLHKSLSLSRSLSQSWSQFDLLWSHHGGQLRHHRRHRRRLVCYQHRLHSRHRRLLCHNLRHKLHPNRRQGHQMLQYRRVGSEAHLGG